MKLRTDAAGETSSRPLRLPETTLLAYWRAFVAGASLDRVACTALARSRDKHSIRSARQPMRVVAYRILFKIMNLY